MKRAVLIGLLGVGMLLGLANAALANTVTLTFTGVNGAVQGGVYVSPYYATIGTTEHASIYCDDFEHHISFNETWTAYVSTFNSLTNVRFTSGGTAATLQRYEEEAWLIEQLASNPTELGNINFAMWAVMDPTVESDAGYTTSGTGSSAWWLSQATTQHFTSGEFSNFEILTPTATGTSSPQEMLTMVPEAGALTLLGIGLIGLAAYFLKRKRAAAEN